MTIVDRKQLQQWLVALKEAAKCVQDEYLPDKMGADWDEEIAQMQAALAQPEHKPVAWMEKDVLPLTHIIKAVVRREKDETYTEPLYTTPPKRTWVGLTDEEMKKVWYAMQNIMGWYSFQEIAKAIELELKDKNT